MEKISMPEALKRLWEKAKQIKYVLIVVFVGLVLIMLPKSEKAEQVNSGAGKETGFSLQAEEERIAEALSKIDGAGKVSVVLTVQSTGETVVAQDTESYLLQEDGETRQENSSAAVIVSEGSQKEAPVTLKIIFPEYQGALVVAEGADNAETRLCITQAVADLTGLSTDKISVVKMKSS